MGRYTRSSVGIATEVAATPPRPPALILAASRRPRSTPATRPRSAALLGDNEMLAELAVRPRDHMHRYELAHARRRLGARLRGRLDRTDIAVDDDGHQPVADLLPAHDHHLGRLHHGVGPGQRRHVGLRLEHAQSILSHFVVPLCLLKWPGAPFCLAGAAFAGKVRSSPPSWLSS